MAKYRLFETTTFQDDLATIARAGRHSLRKKLDVHVYPQLRAEPHYGPQIKRLKNWDPPTWRYRVGSWRFFYMISEDAKIVYLLAAEHRGKSYR